MSYRPAVGEKVPEWPCVTWGNLVDFMDKNQNAVGNQPGPGHAPRRQLTPFLSTMAVNTDADDTDFNEREVVGIKTFRWDFPELSDFTDEATDILNSLPIVEIEKYDKDKHGIERAAITLDIIPRGTEDEPGHGAIAFMGLVQLRIDQKKDTDKSVAPKDATATHVESGSSGWPIWSRGLEDETGEDAEGKQWGVAKLGGGGGSADTSLKFGVVDTAVDPSPMLGTAGTGTVDFTAFGGDALTDVSNYYKDPFPVGMIVSTAQVGGERVIIGAGCTPDS